mmetsp:Transcript_13127/g.33280  ORF Transcript_13127/g.33280 Transcript_13127/m.33280 type:complete len:293 (-) Transcript_13127:949-1827(-)
MSHQAGSRNLENKRRRLNHMAARKRRLMEMLVQPVKGTPQMGKGLHFLPGTQRRMLDLVAMLRQIHQCPTRRKPWPQQNQLLNQEHGTRRSKRSERTMEMKTPQINKLAQTRMGRRRQRVEIAQLMKQSKVERRTPTQRVNEMIQKSRGAIPVKRSNAVILQSLRARVVRRLREMAEQNRRASLVKPSKAAIMPIVKMAHRSHRPRTPRFMQPQVLKLSQSLLHKKYTRLPGTHPMRSKTHTSNPIRIFVTARRSQPPRRVPPHHLKMQRRLRQSDFLRRLKSRLFEVKSLS